MTRNDVLKEIKLATLEDRRINLYTTDLSDINLSKINLSKANLNSSNLSASRFLETNLNDACLYNANLSYANFCNAKLRNADLNNANLSKACFEGADLCGAKLPSPQMLLMANWEDVSDDLCIELMRYDAASHPEPKKFNIWAKGEEKSRCPYIQCRWQRAVYFIEKPELYSPGPSLRPIELAEMVLDEKCPGWREI